MIVSAAESDDRHSSRPSSEVKVDESKADEVVSTEFTMRTGRRVTTLLENWKVRYFYLADISLNDDYSVSQSAFLLQFPTFSTGSIPR